jgi:hypothetical protein
MGLQLYMRFVRPKDDVCHQFAKVSILAILKSFYIVPYMTKHYTTFNCNSLERLVKL